MAGVSGGLTVCAVYAGTQTNASVVAAPAAGSYIVVQWFCISNGAVAGEVELLDGSGGTIKFDAFLPINTPLYVDCRRAPIVLTAATALCFTSVTSTTSRLTVGYTVERS
jgi:hypothetical protein